MYMHIASLLYIPFLSIISYYYGLTTTHNTSRDGSLEWTLMNRFILACIGRWFIIMVMAQTGSASVGGVGWMQPTSLSSNWQKQVPRGWCLSYDTHAGTNIKKLNIVVTNVKKTCWIIIIKAEWIIIMVPG